MEGLKGFLEEQEVCVFLRWKGQGSRPGESLWRSRFLTHFLCLGVMTLTKVNDHIQLFFLRIPSRPVLRVKLFYGLTRVRSPLHIWDLCWAAAGEFCMRQKIAVKWRKIWLWKQLDVLEKLEFIPIYDMKCYLMLPNNFNPTFLTCKQDSSFPWWLCAKVLPCFRNGILQLITPTKPMSHSPLMDWGENSLLKAAVR